MSSVWTLEYSYNQYDQSGSVTQVIFQDKPDFHKLKEGIENSGVCKPTSKGITYDAIIGKLVRGEEVHEEGDTNGGDVWELTERFTY